MAQVVISHLTKRFGSVTVVDDLSLTIREGEFFSLLGPSGCGKSTTLRMLAGLIQPDDGEIYIGGRRVENVPTHKRGLGMVFQNYALFPHLTVAQNVSFGLEMQGISRREARGRVEEALHLVQLNGLEDRYPRELSGGQQQRVAIARAIVTRPKVLLLDEPLSNLDAKLREHMRIELKLLQTRLGITTIFVTHDQVEALTLSDRLAVMNRGRIEQVGTPREVYDRPVSVFVGNFIGDSNTLVAEVQELSTAGATVRTTGGLVIRVPAEQLHPRQSVTVNLRPERLELDPPQPGAHENLVDGVIEFVEYRGATVQYHVKAAGERLLVSVVRRDGEQQRAAGESVRVGWRMTDCLIIPRQVVL